MKAYVSARSERYDNDSPSRKVTGYAVIVNGREVRTYLTYHTAARVAAAINAPAPAEHVAMVREENNAPITLPAGTARGSDAPEQA